MLHNYSCPVARVMVCIGSCACGQALYSLSLSLPRMRRSCRARAGDERCLRGFWATRRALYTIFAWVFLSVSLSLFFFICFYRLFFQRRQAADDFRRDDRTRAGLFLRLLSRSLVSSSLLFIFFFLFGRSNACGRSFIFAE